MLSTVLRDRVPEDTAYLYSSYLRNVHRAHPLRHVPNSLYYRGQTKRMDRLLEEASFVIACFPEEPGEIVGYVIHQPVADTTAIHYLYVRACYRRQGIGKLLLDSAAGDSKLLIATHVCDGFATLRHKFHPRRIVYDPYVCP